VKRRKIVEVPFFRFSIRDLLLSTVIVAVAFGWWVHDHAWRVHYRAVNEDRSAIVGKAIKLRDALRLAKRENDSLHDETLEAIRKQNEMSKWQSISAERVLVDWSLVDEKLPEQ